MATSRKRVLGHFLVWSVTMFCSQNCSCIWGKISYDTYAYNIVILISSFNLAYFVSLRTKTWLLPYSLVHNLKLMIIDGQLLSLQYENIFFVLNMLYFVGMEFVLYIEKHFTLECLVVTIYEWRVTNLMKGIFLYDMVK